MVAPPIEIAMDEVDESDKLVNITEFKNEWHDILTAEDIKGVEGISLHDYMSKNSTIPPEILSELETVCGYVLYRSTFFIIYRPPFHVQHENI